MDESFFTGYLDAWNVHDVEAMLGFFSDDAIYEDVALSRVNRGTGQIREFFEELFKAFPDFRLEDTGTAVIGDGGRYALEWRMSATHDGDLPVLPATHKHWAVRGTSVGEVEGEKIKRNSDYWNMADFLVQVELLPPLPTG